MRWYGSLKRRSDIAFVRRRGRPVAAATFVAYGTASRSPSTAVAVTVAKSVGGAVVRNLVRRRIRGALDGCAPPPSGLRLLFVAKPAAALAPYARLAADVALALERLSRP